MGLRFLGDLGKGPMVWVFAALVKRLIIVLFLFYFFIGSLPVFSAIWIWAPWLCREVYCHGDDESHSGDGVEAIPCADTARQVRGEHEKKQWFVPAPWRDRQFTGDDFYPKKRRQMTHTLKETGLHLFSSISHQSLTRKHPPLPGSITSTAALGTVGFNGHASLGCQRTKYKWSTELVPNWRSRQ